MKNIKDIKGSQNMAEDGGTYNGKMPMQRK
jgi:hypothetical protein